MKFYFKKSTKYLESKKQMTATILKMIYKAYVCFIKTKKNYPFNGATNCLW